MAILKKIKDKIKKIIQPKKAAKPSKIKTTDPSRIQSQAVLGAEELAIGQAKFSHPEPQRTVRTMPHDLPCRYGEDKIILQVRDPWWVHTYWEVTDGTFDRLRQELGDAFHNAKRVLRVYDVSYIIFDGKNAHRFFDVEVNRDTNNWYIDTAGPGKSWCVDYGLLLPDGRFITIVRSNTVYTPLAGPSWITDEEWMIPDDMFARLYGMGFGLGRSSPVGKAWQERIKRELFSGVLASPGMSSSPVKKITKERKFWMVVNTELIVYGATEPDATVFVQGKQISLRPDGTFTLRFALPDGKQVIPVKGVAADKEEERVITPIVTKETK